LKAIILAAGRGSRLKRFTESRPKCLNKVGGRTIVEHQLSALRAEGINEIVIVTGYRGHMLSKLGCEVIRNRSWKRTNMVASLLCAVERFDGPAIVSYADILYGKDTVYELKKQKNDIVVVYDLDWKTLWNARFDRPLQDAESFVIDADSRIRDIGQKVQNIDEIQGQYTGLMRFSAQAFSWIKNFADQQTENVMNKMDMTTLLRLLMQQDYPVCGMAISGGWCEIDTTKDLALANRFHSEGHFISI